MRTSIFVLLLQVPVSSARRANAISRAARRPVHEDGPVPARVEHTQSDGGRERRRGGRVPGQPLGGRQIAYCEVHTPRGQSSMMASSNENEGDGLSVGELMEIQVIAAYCRL